MLTGDKFETAYEVAKSCKLIEPSYEVIECKSSEVPIKRYIDSWEY
jgi:magnesium-transporting ATPase (P-type)